MTTDEIFDEVRESVRNLGRWLLEEPVHRVLVYLLAAFTLVLMLYLIVSHWHLRRRLLSIELRHTYHDIEIRRTNLSVGDLRRKTDELSRPPGHLDQVQENLDTAVIDREADTDPQLRTRK